MIYSKVQHNVMEIMDSPNNKAKQKTDFVWAPYCLDLNPLGFFLWVHLKDIVYRDSPATSLYLKDSISNHVERVKADKDICARVIKNFKTRSNLCIEPTQS